MIVCVPKARAVVSKIAIPSKLAMLVPKSPVRSLDQLTLKTSGPISTSPTAAISDTVSPSLVAVPSGGAVMEQVGAVFTGPTLTKRLSRPTKSSKSVTVRLMACWPSDNIPNPSSLPCESTSFAQSRAPSMSLFQRTMSSVGDMESSATKPSNRIFCSA